MRGDGKHGGVHYTDWVDEVKRRRRAGDEAAAESLLFSLLEAVEAESKKERLPPPTWYYTQLAIIAAKRRDSRAEVAVLERYIGVAKGRSDPDLRERLRKAKAKAKLVAASSKPVSCPACKKVLDPPPQRSRKCPLCGEPITVRTKNGFPQLFTSADLEQTKRVEAQRTKYDASLRRANELGLSDAEFEREVKSHGGRHRDAFWALSNRQVLESDAYRRKMIYRLQADHTAEEGRDWLPSARLAVQEEERLLRLDDDDLVSVAGCTCAACSATPDLVRLGEIRGGSVIPHADCAEPPCTCWIYVPPETRRVEEVVSVVNLGALVAPRQKRSLLKRLFGGTHE